MRSRRSRGGPPSSRSSASRGRSSRRERSPWCHSRMRSDAPAPASARASPRAPREARQQADIQEASSATTCASSMVPTSPLRPAHQRRPVFRRSAHVESKQDPRRASWAWPGEVLARAASHEPQPSMRRLRSKVASQAGHRPFWRIGTPYGKASMSAGSSRLLATASMVGWTHLDRAAGLPGRWPAFMNASV